MGSIPEFWAEALEVIRAAPIAYLATSYPAGGLAREFAGVESGDQPTVRAVTPAYVGTTAYIATEPRSFKVRSAQHNPLVDLLHWHRDFRHVNLRGRARLVEDAATLEAMWDQFDYDLSDFFGEDGAEYGLLSIEPFRIELMSLRDYAASKPPRVWRAGD